MRNCLGLLSQIELIKSVNAQEMKLYLADGSFKTVDYGKNNIVHFVGDVCTKLEIIISGRVVVERIDEAGNLMTIAEFFKGDILGGNLMFSKKPHFPMTVTAKEFTTILEINKDRLFKLFSEKHDFLSKYLEYVADHTVILGDRIKQYMNRTIRDNILSYLDYECKRQQSNSIKLTMTKKSLAEKMGIQRTSLSRELTKMRDEGLIDFDSVYIKIL